jgi:TPR repeat protein
VDVRAARRYLLLAAQNGDLGAQMEMARFLLNSTPLQEEENEQVKPEEEEEVIAIDKEATESREKRAFELFRLAADKGVSEALVVVADALHCGKLGQSVNRESAHKYYEDLLRLESEKESKQKDAEMEQEEKSTKKKGKRRQPAKRESESTITQFIDAPLSSSIASDAYKLPRAQLIEAKLRLAANYETGLGPGMIC